MANKHLKNLLVATSSLTILLAGINAEATAAPKTKKQKNFNVSDADFLDMPALEPAYTNVNVSEDVSNQVREVVKTNTQNIC